MLGLTWQRADAKYGGLPLSAQLLVLSLSLGSAVGLVWRRFSADT